MCSLVLAKFSAEVPPLFARRGVQTLCRVQGVHWLSPGSKGKYQLSHRQSTAKWQDKPTRPSSSSVRHNSNVLPMW